MSPRVEHSDLLQARPAEACRGASHDGDDMAIMTTMPEEQLMPLSRLNDGFEIELEGIAFWWLGIPLSDVRQALASGETKR